MNPKAPPGPQTWLSGDWTKQPNSKPPFNGVKIVATPVYDEQKHTLTTLMLVLSDFTLVRTGANLQEAFKTIRNEARIELPKPTGDLTLEGSLELLLTGTPDKILLFIDLSWGLEHSRHTANGGILEVPLIDTDGTAASPPAPATTDDVSSRPPSTEQLLGTSDDDQGDESKSSVSRNPAKSQCASKSPEPAQNRSANKSPKAAKRQRPIPKTDD